MTTEGGTGSRHDFSGIDDRAAGVSVHPVERDRIKRGAADGHDA